MTKSKPGKPGLLQVALAALMRQAFPCKEERSTMRNLFLIFNVSQIHDGPDGHFPITFHKAANLICQFNGIMVADRVRVFDVLTSTDGLEIPPTLRADNIAVTNSDSLQPRHQMIVDFLSK